MDTSYMTHMVTIFLICGKYATRWIFHVDVLLTWIVSLEL